MASKQFAEALKKATQQLNADARVEQYYNDPVLWAEERAGVILWSKQKEILRSVAENKRTAVKSCHSIGKDIPIDTPIPTPTGWTTMGDLQVGDYVLGADGKPTKVVYVSDVMHTVNYELTFSDGTKQVAGEDHQWNTLDFKARARIKNRVGTTSKDWRDYWHESKTVTTKEIAETLKSTNGQSNHLIPINRPLELPEAELPFDPYLLGAWLGDGSSSAAYIYAAADGKHILDKFEAKGYKITKLASDPYGYKFHEGHPHGAVRQQLKDAGVFKNKHIPMLYLRASKRQRLELLKGILDTDGFVVNGSSAGIDLANRRLAYDIAELVRSLGVRVNVRDGGHRYRLAFTPTFNPFSPESHKYAKFEQSTTESTRRVTGRVVVSAEVVPTVPTKCITVDNADSLYLAGEDFIPTHNTFLSAIAAGWWVDTRFNSMVQSTAPTYEQVHAQLWEEIRKLHTNAGLPGTVNEADQWKRPMKNEATGRTKTILVGQGRKPADNNIHGFHGIHRPDGVLVLLDEGCGLHQSLFTGSEAITTAEHDRQLTTGNPDDPDTEFGKIFQEQGHLWNLITVSAFDTPNFTGEADELREKYKDDPDKLEYVERMLRGLPQPDTIDEQRAAWGEDSPRYMSKVLAEFPLVAEDSLFTPADIATGLANNIEPEPDAFKVLGVDPARYGEDKAAIVLNTEGKIEVVALYQTMDLMELAARVHKHAMDLRVDQVRVDTVGLGGGVLDRLVTLSYAEGKPYSVIEMVAHASPPDRTLHRDSRAYWNDSFKHKLRSGLIDLPDNKELLNEMSRVRYEYPNGVMKIESKTEMRKRGVPSPNILDAAVMATAPIVTMENNPLASARPGQTAVVDFMPQITSVSPY